MWHGEARRSGGLEEGGFSSAEGRFKPSDAVHQTSPGWWASCGAGKAATLAMLRARREARGERREVEGGRGVADAVGRLHQRGETPP